MADKYELPQITDTYNRLVVRLLSYMLLIENSQQQHQTGAAIDAFKNEVAEQNLNIGQRFLDKLMQTQLPKKGK